MPILNKTNKFLDEVYKIRVENLKAIAKDYGTDKAFAHLLGITPGRLHSLMRRKDITFTEKMARAIEDRLDLPAGRLDEQAREVTKTPIYIIDDVKDLENSSPISYSSYYSDEAGQYFVKILNKSYEPVINAGAKILINPHKTKLEKGGIYLLSLIENSKPSRPIIRQYKEDHEFLNLVSKEIEILDTVKIYGHCETLVSSFLSVVG